MKKRAALLLLVAAVFACSVIPAIHAGSVAEKVISDDFSASTLDAASWSTSGGKIAPVETGGALVMKTVMGYNHSLMLNGYTFEPETNYVIEFDTSIKSSSEAWLGVLFGGDDFGAVYNNKCANGIVITGRQNESTISVFKNGSTTSVQSISGDFIRGNGNKRTFKFDVKFADNAYTADFWSKPADRADYADADKVGTIKLDGFAGHMYFQANDTTNSSVVKVMNFKIKQNGETVFSENFEKPTSECLDMTAGRTGKWLAPNENYATGLGYALKFDNAENSALVAKYEFAESAGNVDLFDYQISLGLKNMSAGMGFGLVTGGDTAGAGGDFIFFVKNGEAWDLGIHRSGASVPEKLNSKPVAVGDGSKIGFAGKYNKDLAVGVDGSAVVTVRNCKLAGYLALAARPVPAFAGVPAANSNGTVSAMVYSAELIRYGFRAPKAGAVGNNFDAMKNGSTTAGYLDTSKWRSEGNVSIRKGALKFSSGDPNTSFNTKEKYQDYIMRFSVTGITDTYFRDEQDAYTTDGYYADMSIGICVGKNEYNISSVAGDHLSIQICPKYMKTNSDGMIEPNMILWGYGGLLDDGSSAAWPTENWWHDGSDGKIVTGTDGLSVDVMVIVQNRTVSLYYKYGNQDDSYLEVPKAVFVNVNTYGYAAVSCGYNSSFEVDNLSITPLSFENYV